MVNKKKTTRKFYIYECEHCGKIYSTVCALQKYCCKKCRIEAQKKRLEEMAQPCMRCQRATGKCIDSIICPWAMALLPVPGWDATPHLFKECGKEDIYYTIHSCPLFLQDPPRKGRS